MEEGLLRVKELIQKLKNFSRIDEGEVKNCDIHENINSVLFLLQHKMKDGVEVDCQFTENGFLTCQPGPLNQVLMNLISNAVDAIDGEGRITIRTWENEDMFHISIADNGPGIPADIKDRIFEPFFTTKPVGDGTGLGLSISYKIVEAHNGRIQVDGNDEGGTTFTLDLPKE